ncbi:cytochrome P450 72A397 isoform X2 [Cryptomeria japonica]|uniref:cytochrome P450 72A397 isoform X2 n=1 Tax=Cryptomeria japonica TaxID=3369 RepID=UPI0025AD3479|nr:cytochrome P450 72A397 isoform X2 [Cryptomeria japonica]
MSGWSDDVADAWSWNARFWSAMQESRALTMMREYVVHEVNAILWALLIIVTGLLLRRVWRLLRFWVRGSRLPGPPLNALARNKGCDALDQFTAFLGQAHKDYGSVVRVWLGPTQLLVSVKDPELIQHLLVQAKDRLPLTGKAFQLAFGKSSLFVSSFAQVQSRRISLERQLNGKFLERVHSISLKVVDRIKQWADVGPSGLELDCKTASQHMAFSILGATLFGDGFLIWPAAREFEDLLMMIAKECCFWATYNVLPLWNKNFQRYKATCLRLQDLTKHMIQEGKNQHRNVIESYNKIESANIDAGIAAGYGGTSGEFVEDLIAGIISSKDSSGNLNLSEEIRGDIMGMMFHGCLTTTGIISGVLTKLAQHPEVQAKVYQEIVSICGKSATPSFTDVQKMHFLLATIYESARLLPAGPLLQRCSLKHDMKLTKEITVPAGAILAVPIQLVQMDACKWGDDAEIFNPDRFLKQKTVNSDSCKIKGDSHKAVGLTEQGDLVENSDGQSAGSDFKDPDINYSFLPFGSGSRVCVGKRFASVEMTALLASLLQRYEIKLGPDSDMDLKPKIENFTLQLFPSPKLSLVPRGF